MTDKHILIVGGGTFGLSTAYHLAKSGYTHITVLEKDSLIPSEASAGNDLNKIIRAEYEDSFYTELALEAINQWKTNPLFAPYYHQVGYLLATSINAPDKAKRTLAKSLSSIQNHPAFSGGLVTPVESRADIKSVAPAFSGPMEWRGYFNRLAGYAHAADSLHATFAACRELGVEFVLGDGAKILLLDEGAGGNRKCKGVATDEGEEHEADVVVLTMGASLGRLLPEIGPQVAAKAFSVAHIQLDEAEAENLRGIPVTYARDLGFFSEPDPRTRLLKICPSGAGITNFAGSDADDSEASHSGKEKKKTKKTKKKKKGRKISVPPEDSSFIPHHDEEAVRKLVRDTLPEFADRPLVKCHMCWCADARDTEYIIDYVPQTTNLVVFSGDSGHGFKMLPTAGLWVKKLIEEGVQKVVRWRWKERKEDCEGDGDVSWRVGEVHHFGRLLMEKEMGEMDRAMAKM
ncbi:fad dependent oxidoreductase [Zalerion maritima]|uniref:Fad dependent oxidoreductase n=1 Tax=Zalerion maritima TaxID=339359 RepID=A0AAD5WNR8_9PEZI|nr:fad dependent oxidoreductase [Zalerion maritima]